MLQKIEFIVLRKLRNRDVIHSAVFCDIISFDTNVSSMLTQLIWRLHLVLQPTVHSYQGKYVKTFRQCCSCFAAFGELGSGELGSVSQKFVQRRRHYENESNVCQATTVTHTKRIDRNLLRKETNYVYYTSSVLRKSRHMKQKEKITHCC